MGGMSPRPRARKETSTPLVDFLGLPGWVTTDPVDDSDPHVIHVPAQALTEPKVGCDRCGSLPYTLAPNGTRRQFIMDEPRGGRAVEIELRRQAYRCRKCGPGGKTTLQPLPGVDERRKITLRLRDYIRREAARREYIDVAREVGLDATTVADIFSDYVEELESSLRFETPEWMGIDEVYLCGETYCVVTNIKERTVFDILPDREKSTVKAFLRGLPDRGRVKLVTMDLWNAYRDVVHKELPRAAVVVDKFHVLRMVKRVVDRVRIRVSQTLTREQKALLRNFWTKDEERAARWELLKSIPELKLAEGAMWRFQRIWQSENPVTALRETEEWGKRIPEEVSQDFKGMVRHLKQWEREIFAYFDPGHVTEDDRRATNAYTEAMNRIIRSRFRRAPNLSYKSLRAKVLYTVRAADGGRTSARSSRARRAETIRALQEQRSEMLGAKMQHGVPITTLADDLTGGRSFTRGKPVQHDFPDSPFSLSRRIMLIMGFRLL